MKSSLKKTLSWLLALTMCLSLLPAAAFADEEECTHEYVTEVTEPTCTEGGYTTHTCSLCGTSYMDEETEALGHSYEDVPKVEPQVGVPGHEAGSVCSVCGDVQSGYEEIPALTETVEEEETEEPAETPAPELQPVPQENAGTEPEEQQEPEPVEETTEPEDEPEFPVVEVVPEITAVS